MSQHFTSDEVYEGVRLDLSEGLAVEPEEITREANFFNDLGGESIDLLDLAFRSERRFGIRAPFQRLISRDTWQFDESGQLRAESLHHLQKEFPGIDWASRLASADLKEPRDLLTIDLIVELLFHAQRTTAISTAAL